MAPGQGARRLDDPDLIRQEYERPERLAERMRVTRQETDGESPVQAVIDAVLERAPRTVLDIGCGDGGLAAELAVSVPGVVAVDLSETMVSLARARGVDARVADIQDLPFPASSFDCVVAAWMLYHAAGLDRAIAETARVLTPTAPVTFTTENGRNALAPYFDTVIHRRIEGRVAFATREEVRDYVASTIRRAHLVERIPAELGAMSAVSRHSVFTCDGPR